MMRYKSHTNFTLSGQRLRATKTTSDHNNQLTQTPRQCNCNTFTQTPIQGANTQRNPTLPLADLDMDTTLPIDPVFSFLQPYSPSQDLFSTTFTLPPTFLSPLSQPAPPQTVFSALYLNGAILGLSCSVCITSVSPLPLPHHPPSLHPTESQLLIAHPRWYDRLPFPAMRDSLIRLKGVLDEEELLRDLCTMPSWRIDAEVGWERCCWDPGAWRMEKAWEGKWGWLMG